MKYRLVLAEDEPAAAENIHDIIRLYCPEFELAAVGENGAEGLELARRLHPDLLLTDIKMPVMNGLDLIKSLHDEMPEIKTIILSGYQDFEFARTALQQGAVDYLLKPISPSTLQTTLNRIIPLMENDRAQRRLNIIRELLSGGKIPDEKQDSFFPAPGYFIGLCRKNGLPGRFTGIGRIIPPASSAKDDVIDFYGKDDMECIHIEPEHAYQEKIQWDRISWLNRDIPGYQTIVYHIKPIPLKELPQCMEELYNTLAYSLVTGKSQIIASGDRGSFSGELSLSFTDTSLMYYLKENRSQKIKDLLREQLDVWEKSDVPQYLAEEGIHSFFEQICQLYPEDKAIAPEDRIEFLINDAFYYATGYEDLENNLLYILDKLLPAREPNINKIDTPEFFNLIGEFIKDKLAEPISLQQSCIHFGISQTYMSKLFRKYTGLSFTNYLTQCRIEKAKQYLAGGKTLVRDAAAMTGFSDQFYFSKVFRSLTGLSPSEFISSNHS